MDIIKGQYFELSENKRISLTSVYLSCLPQTIYICTDTFTSSGKTLPNTP